MAVSELSPTKYGNLLAEARPKIITSDAELDRYVDIMERLDRCAERTGISPEEEALRDLLARLIKDYDDRIELPPGDPISMIQFLMEQRGLRATDLTPIFGARSIASMVLNGKRELSKTHIRKLAEFFHVSPVVFLT